MTGGGSSDEAWVRETINRGVLSAEAQVRLERSRSGAGTDLPTPNLVDHEAVAGWRAEQHARWGEEVRPGEPAHKPEMIAGVRCLLAGNGPTLIYLHGGGFYLGSPGTAVPITSRLAAGLGVVSVDYRLAPEHPFPAGLHDAIAVCEAVASQTGSRVLVGGDSAGANLAVGVARSTDAVNGLVLLSPHLDFRRTDHSGARDAYLAGASVHDPLASPLAADDLHRLPPTLIQTSTSEVMFQQACLLAHHTTQRRDGSTLQVWDGLWHAWHYHRELPEAWDAVDRALAWAGAIGRLGVSTVEDSEGEPTHEFQSPHSGPTRSRPSRSD